MKKFKNYAKGFTLIELLVVIAIIGILSSVVLVSLNTARQKGKDGRIQAETAQLRTQLEANYDGTGYPDLVGTATANIAATTSTATNFGITASDIMSLNGGTTGKLNTAASASNGVTVYSDAGNGNKPTKYSIYSKLTNGGGYFCIGSNGQTLTNTTSATLPGIPTSVDICQ